MANVRIKDITTTASAPNDDDYLAIDGATAGTRKISAANLGGDALTTDIKDALLQIASKVAYIDDQGQTYYEDLYDALYAITAITLNTNSLSFASLNTTQQLTATTTPVGGNVTWSSSNTSIATVDSTGLVTSGAYGSCTITATAGSISATCSVVVAQATLIGISATYTQSGTVYESDTLDSLKSDLVVTASWSDSTTSTVPANDYTLSGTLTEGTSTITVSYEEKTTTFDVIVSETPHYLDATLTYEEGHTITASDGTVWAYDSTLNYYTTESNVLFKKLVCYFDETKSTGNLWGRGESSTQGRMFECWIGGVKAIGYRLYNIRHPSSGAYQTASPVTFDNGTCYDANSVALDTYTVADLSFNCLGGRNGGNNNHALLRIVADI